MSKEDHCVKIKCTLTTHSLLHCGSGEIIAITTPDKDNKENTTKNTSDICKSGNTPYIPASTLRGSLRSFAITNDKHITLFGHAEGNGLASKIRVYDAVMVGDNKNAITTYTRTSIDPITNTNKEHHLFSEKVVVAGTKFTLNIELDNVTDSDLTYVLSLLSHWNGSMHTAIGANRSNGWGRITIDKNVAVKTLTKEAIKKWVTSNDAEPIWIESKKEVPDIVKSSPIGYSLECLSPLLINDEVRAKKTKIDTCEAAAVFMRIGNKAIIPGSSLHGLVRAHAHKIMATIAHMFFGVESHQAHNKVSVAIQALFGSEDNQSLVWFSDAIDKTKSEKHTQRFNAVDRFTGGALNSALFRVEAASCEKLTGTIEINDKKSLEGWQKGLLFLVVQDFMEGDFAIGWGKRIGYGQAILSLDKPMDKNTENIEALHNKINNIVNKETK